MKKLSFKLGKETVRKFSSLRGLFVYALDISIKVVLLALMSTLGIIHFFISTESVTLSRYLAVYIVSVVAWGLLLVKYVYRGKKTFGKTKFDLFFMGLLLIFLVSVLFGQNRNVGVFGALNTWSHSVLTILSVSIIYYAIVIQFKYLRGVKWLGLGVVLSMLIPGSYFLLNFNAGRKLGDGITLLIYVLLIVPVVVSVFTTKLRTWLKVFLSIVVLGCIYFSRNLLSGDASISLNFLRYVVYTIPLGIALIFIFRKVWLKILTAGAIIINLFFISDYSRFVSSAMFVLSVGVLALFILFYFSFWIKNNQIMFGFVKKVFKKGKDIRRLKKVIKQNRREAVITSIMLFVALWILGFGAIAFNYWQSNIGSFIGKWYSDDLGNMSSVKMWIIGENNLANEFSSFELLSVLGNYGILSAVIFVAFFVVAIVNSAKVVLKFLYSGRFKNVILAASIFVGQIILFVSFLIMRFSAMTYFAFVIYTSLLSIIEDLIEQKELFEFKEMSEELSVKRKIINLVLTLAFLGVIVAGVVGIFSGIEKELYFGNF